MYKGLNLRDDGSENVNYNIPDYPIYAGQTIENCGLNVKIARHWHADIELSLVIKGRMGYFVNGMRYIAHEGQCMFINSGRPHYNYKIGDYDCQYRCVLVDFSVLCGSDYIKKAYIDGIIGQKAADCRVLDTAFAADSSIIAAMNNIFDLLTREYEHPGLRIAGQAMLIADALYRMGEGDVSVNRKFDQRQAALNDMVAYIQQNYSKNLRLKDISAAGTVSKCSCNALFQDEFHVTPIEYLVRYRINRSQELLRNTSMNITEIALAVGFNWQSYFSEAFRKFTGQSPTAYRAEVLTDLSPQ